MYLFTMPMRKHRKKILLAVVAATALTLAAGAAARVTGTTLSLVAYSTPKPVMAKIIQAYQQTPQGQGVNFTQSYGPSTNQAKAVSAGQPADFVFLSAGDDVNLLVDAGLVNPNWDKQSYNGIAANTVVVFAVRDGNPKHIKSWADLIKPGVQVVTPNPFSSGSAKWNILAAYGAQRAPRQDRQAGDRVRAGSSSSTSCRRTRRARTPRTRSSRARATCCSPTRARQSTPASRGRTSST